MKTYTEAEVADLLAKAAGSKPIEAKVVNGISKKTQKPYTGIRVTGNFPPQYLSRTVALALASPEGNKALTLALR